MYLNLTLRHCATYDGLRQTAWVHAVDNGRDIVLSLAGEMPSGDVPLYQDRRIRAADALDYVAADHVMLDLPPGRYSLHATVEGRTVSRAWHHGPRVTELLAEAEDTLRRRLALEIGDPDLTLSGHGVTLGMGDIVSACVATWGDSIRNTVRVSDAHKIAPDMDIVRYILSVIGTSEHSYEAEAFDCDDFAYHLAGRLHNPNIADGAWGIVWGRYEDGSRHHAQNLVIASDRQVYLIEPQTGSIMPPDPDWTPYVIII